MHRLADAVGGMLEVFAAASEQLKLEDQGYEAEAKRHDTIISKLDKAIDQNRTIAEGMVAIVELVKEKFGSEKEEVSFASKEEKENVFKAKPEQKPFAKMDWKPDVQIQRPQPLPQSSMMPSMTSTVPLISQPQNDFGMRLPPMQPTPGPDLDFPEEPFPLDEDNAQKKKGLFGMFKK